MKRLLAILLTVAMLLSLAACAEKEEVEIIVYEGMEATVMGITLPLSEVYAGDTRLELGSDGTGTLILDGEAFPLKWLREGDSLTLTIDKEDSVGTFKDNLICIDLMGLGCEITFGKDKVLAQQAWGTHEDTGYWELIRIESDDPDSAVSEEDLAMLKEMQLVVYLDLYEDGTGIFVSEEEEAIVWKDGMIAIDGEMATYTRENDLLLMQEEGTTLVFQNCQMPAFLYSELEAAGFTEYMEVGVKYPFEILCYKDYSKTSTAEVIVTDYQIFEEAEGYPAREGYEWRVATMQIRVYDNNARYYQVSTSFRFEDYYNTILHDDSSPDWQETSEGSGVYFSTYTLIHEGQVMDAYHEYTDSGWSKWNKTEGDQKGNTRTYVVAYQVPVGYDGAVIGYYDSTTVPDGNNYITEYDPSAFMLFRMT